MLGALKMIIRLSKNLEDMLFKLYEPLTKKIVIQYITMFLLATATALCIRFFHLMSTPTLPVVIPENAFDIIYMVLLAPITEEFITRAILIYLIGALLLCRVNNSPSCAPNATEKIVRKNKLFLPSAFLAASFNYYMLTSWGSERQIIIYICYLFFLCSAIILFHCYSVLRGLIFFVFLLGSCLFFAAFHPYMEFFIYYFIFAVLNSYWAIKTRSVMMIIIAHIYLNAVSMFIMILQFKAPL